ncbi:hypothetical protein, partial [Streptomyces mirabilis]|uniref:hypothetical protein n=1 Tax=Streptomyces mirabilis TaxID=68239 RepID=UPI0033E0BD98
GLKSPPPPGSQHYRSGWDDGLEAAMDAARDAVLSVLPATTNQAAAARLDRVREWVTSDVVTAQTEFGNGYRASQRDIRDLIKGRFDNDAANELRRVAGETQQPETPRQWCKCRSCWGWFVEEHPGEDLDELGKDLGWWSGLPEHRDAPTPAVVVQPAEPADTQQAERGEEADRG